MQKSIIEELLNTYHWRENEKSSSINPWFYRKGWLKRLLHTSTRGAAELEQFFESDDIKSLLPEQEITGENLKELLYLIEARNNRINKTERDYLKKPSKRTNRMYRRLNDLLLLDTLSEKESLLPSREYCIQVLFAHYADLIFGEIEKKALAGEAFETENGPILFSSQLAKALTTGEAYHFNFSSLTAISEEDEDTKILQFENQQIEFSFQFIDGQLSTVKIRQAKIALEKNVQDRLKWLKLSSSQGDSTASYELAEHYEKSQVSSFAYNVLDGIRSWRYLRIANQQGSDDYAAKLIDDAQQQDISSLIANNEKTHELTQCITHLNEATEEISEATRVRAHEVGEAATTITSEAERLKITVQKVEDETLEQFEAIGEVMSELVRKKDELEAVLHQQSENSVVNNSEQLTLLSNELLQTQEELNTIKQKLKDYVNAFDKLFQENETNKKLRKDSIDLLRKYQRILKEILSESTLSKSSPSSQSDGQGYHPQFWSNNKQSALKRSASCTNLIMN